MRNCGACGGEVRDEFRFCPHCGKAQRTKIVEYFRGHPDVGDGGLRVSVYLGEPRHARFSVWHGEEADAAISLDPDETPRRLSPRRAGDVAAARHRPRARPALGSLHGSRARNRGRVARARARRDRLRPARRARAGQGRDRLGPPPPPAGLRSLAAPANRDGRGRGARRPPPRAHARHAARARRPQPRPQELDVGDEPVAAGRRAGGEGGEAGHAATSRPRRSCGRSEVRARRRPRRARARLRAAHRRLRRRRLGREGAPPRDRRRGCRGGTARGGRRPRRGRRGAPGEGHARRPRRGAGDRRPTGARLLRPARGPARRAARRGRDGDPGREGRRDRRRLRARRPARLRGARRDRHRQAAYVEPRRRHRGRRLERGGDRRPRRDEAAADADEAARLRRPRDGRGGGGPRRAERRLRCRGARGRRGGGGRLGARAGGTGEVRRRRARRFRRRVAGVPGAALNRQVAIVGFMGSGKSTAARAVGGIDADDLIESAAGKPIPAIFRDEGEAAFRAREAEAVVLALGGGAVTSPKVRDALGEALTVWLDVDVDTCWERVRGSDRPLAQDEAEFRRLYEERRRLYAEVADVVARDVDDVVLATAGVVVERGALQKLGELVPGDGAVALISDAHVAGIHGMDAQLALGSRLAETHELPAGEEAKTLAAVERLWQELRLDRPGTIVALGGGCTTDAAGYAASAYLRGVPWVPVATSLVAQVDAAIGGKTGLDLPQGKNLVGAFHWPALTVIDPALP